MEISPFMKWCVEISPVIGVFGDSATFAGSYWLARDAIKREQEFTRIRNVIARRKLPSIADLKLDMEGIILSSDDDVERAFIRFSARRAIWGCVLLAIGFFALLLVRVIEFWK